MPNSKPNPEAFAREVLEQLTGLRAEMHTMLHMFTRHIEPDIPKADKMYLDWVRASGGLQKKMYDEALNKIGIPPSGRKH